MIPLSPHQMRQFKTRKATLNIQPRSLRSPCFSARHVSYINMVVIWCDDSFCSGEFAFYHYSCICEKVPKGCQNFMVSCNVLVVCLCFVYQKCHQKPDKQLSKKHKRFQQATATFSTTRCKWLGV